VHGVRGRVPVGDARSLDVPLVAPAGDQKVSDLEARHQLLLPREVLVSVRRADDDDVRPVPSRAVPSRASPSHRVGHRNRRRRTFDPRNLFISPRRHVR
jgi:hypothetical protein